MDRLTRPAMTVFDLPSLGADAPPAPGTRRSADLDRNAFLRLLVAQLSNQDPLSPHSGHEFAAQLAQFSSVEQLTQIGATLSQHSKQLAALAESAAQAAAQQAALAGQLHERTTLSTATALIGRVVEATGRHTVWDGREPAALAFALPRPAAEVTVTVRDAHGRVVRTFEAGHAAAGTQTVAWDGRDDAGAPLPPGAYTFSIAARDAQGRDIPATTFTRGRVERITIDTDGARLWIGPLAVPLTDVRSVVP